MTVFRVSKRILLTLVVLLALVVSLIPFQSRADSWSAQWAILAATAPDTSYFYSGATDDSGNVYAVGYINGTEQYSFGNDVTVSGTYSGEFGNYSALIVKYDSEGVAQWAKSTVSGNQRSYFRSVATDDLGNIYAVGDIRGSGEFDFGNDVTATGGSFADSSPLIVKYSSQGTAQWAKTVTSEPDKSTYLDVATDSSENVYVVGEILAGEYNFGNDVTVTGGIASNNALIVKYNSSGTTQWAKSTTSAQATSKYSGVAVSGSNVYAAGWISCDQEFGFGDGVTATATSSYGSSAIFVKYNSSGVAQLARTNVTDDGDSVYKDIAVDADENIYSVGYIQGISSYNFGNDVSVAGSFEYGKSVLITKYNSSSTAQWARTATIAEDDYSSFDEYNAVAVDGNGHVYAVGQIKGEMEYDFGDNVKVNGAATSKATIVRYDTDGATLMAKVITSLTGYSLFEGLAVSGEGDVYTVGYIYGNAQYEVATNKSAEKADYTAYAADGDLDISGSYASDNNAFIVKYADSPDASQDPVVTPTPTATTTETASSDQQNGYPPVFVNLPGSDSSINIAEGQTITVNPYIIRVKPTSDGGISRVLFYVDDILICTATAADANGVYSCSWDTSKYHSVIKVYAYDDLGNRSAVLQRVTVVDPRLYLIELPATGWVK